MIFARTNIVISFIMIMVVLLLAVSAPAMAADEATGLLDNIGENPNLCDALQLLINIKNLLLQFLGVVSVLFVIYGGYTILISAGSPALRQKGQDIIKHALIGLVIVLLSWLIVSSIFAILGYPQSFLPWINGSEIRCN